MCLAIPGEIIRIFAKHGLSFAQVRFGGIEREVCLQYQPSAQVGEFVLVHVGFAIATIDAAEAEQTLRLLNALGEQDELIPPRRSALAPAGPARGEP